MVEISLDDANHRVHRSVSVLYREPMWLKSTGVYYARLVWYVSVLYREPMWLKSAIICFT